MDKFDKVTWGKANSLKFWSSLVLMAASGLIMLQAPLAHADSPAANMRTTELGQRVTFYVQPVYQSDPSGDWQVIPGVKPIKMVGNVGGSFQVPVYKNFVPTTTISHTVPDFRADLQHPLLLKYSQESTGLYTATVNINYMNRQDSHTLDSATKTLHYADQVTIKPKKIQGYQPVEATFESPYFTKNNDQSVNFCFRELRDLTCLVKFWYQPVNASQPDQAEQVKETRPKQNHAEGSTNSHAGTDSKLVEAAKPVTQDSGDTKPASSNVAPVLPVNSTDQAQKSAPQVEVKQQRPTVPQPTLITKEPVFQAAKPVETKAASLPSDLSQVAQQSPVVPSKPTNSTRVNVAGKSQISVSRQTESVRTSSRPATDSHLGATGVAILNNSTHVGQATITQPTPNKKVAVKGMAVYAIKTVGLYSSPNFKAVNRLFRYPAQKRYARPMFVVTGYARSATGKLRYRVRDVNHQSPSHGKTGYLTANWTYVRPVYYASRHPKIKVINPTGIHGYQGKNLTGRVATYKMGQTVNVKRMVHYHLTTRFVLADGSYITANRKLVSAFK